MSQTNSQQTSKDRPGQQQNPGQQQQKPQDKPGQLGQTQNKADNADRAQRTPNIPGSRGVETPGREELGNSEPGDEQGRAGQSQDAGRKGRPDQDMPKDEKDAGCGCGDASAAKHDTNAQSGGSKPGQR